MYNMLISFVTKNNILTPKMV